MQDAEIVAWHVAEGEHVVADQPLVSVETDKAVVEVPAPRAGRIARLYRHMSAIASKSVRALVDFEEGAHADSGDAGRASWRAGSPVHLPVTPRHMLAQARSGQPRPQSARGRGFAASICHV